MRRVWVRELTGWFAALAMALITAAQVASTARAELLFRDGDSLIVALFSRSLLSGEPLDWAMSSVLFLPEAAVFVVLDVLLPLDADGLLAVNAVVNLLALYGAVRLVAGRRRPTTAPVAWSLLAVGVFAVLAVTETSASRDALELASLPLTTTYYAGTVVAVVASIGLVRRVLDSGAGRPGLLGTLAAVAALSTLSNPLFAAWATIPLSLILAVMTIRSPQRLRLTMLLVTLIGASVLGFLGRIPLQAWIANTGAGYIQPDAWTDSLAFYAGLAADRVTTAGGVIAGLIVLALLLFAALRTAQAHDAGSGFVAAAAWVVPALVVIGAVSLGTHAARYLQPLAFAPVLALVATPRAWRPVPRASTILAGAGAVVLVAAGGMSVPRLTAAAAQPDPDLACVTDWVDGSGRTGAGQFWTVRLPKLHLDDPGRLVQVDHELNGYAWLVNRHDFDVGEVSFLVEDAQTVAWSLPVHADPDEVITCGRYRILDFGDTSLPIGPLRS